MKQGRLSFSAVRRLRQSPVFAFLVATLLCGAAAGSLTGMHLPQSAGSYAEDLAALVAENVTGALPSARTVAACIGGTFGWAAGALVLGALPGRMLWVGLLAALRGFLLAFAVAAALLESGWRGVYLSAVSIGASAALWLPGLLLVCAAALDAAQARGKRGYAAALFGRSGGALGLSALLLSGAVLWRLLAVPALLGLVGA